MSGPSCSMCSDQTDKLYFYVQVAMQLLLACIDVKMQWFRSDDAVKLREELQDMQTGTVQVPAQTPAADQPVCQALTQERLQQCLDTFLASSNQFDLTYTEVNISTSACLSTALLLLLLLPLGSLGLIRSWLL